MPSSDPLRGPPSPEIGGRWPDAVGSDEGFAPNIAFPSVYAISSAISIIWVKVSRTSAGVQLSPV